MRSYCISRPYTIPHIKQAKAAIKKAFQMQLEGKDFSLVEVVSPIITEPELLVVMNGPSLDKFENAVLPGGKIFIDSTLISRECTRSDVTSFRIPATQMANDMGMPKLANMIMVGKLIKETDMFTWDQLIGAITKLVPPAKAAMLESNIKALEAGYNY